MPARRSAGTATGPRRRSRYGRSRSPGRTARSATPAGRGADLQAGDLVLVAVDVERVARGQLGQRVRGGAARRCAVLEIGASPAPSSRPVLASTAWPTAWSWRRSARSWAAAPGRTGRSGPRSARVRADAGRSRVARRPARPSAGPAPGRSRAVRSAVSSISPQPSPQHASLRRGTTPARPPRPRRAGPGWRTSRRLGRAAWSLTARRGTAPGTPATSSSPCASASVHQVDQVARRPEQGGRLGRHARATRTPSAAVSRPAAARSSRCARYWRRRISMADRWQPGGTICPAIISVGWSRKYRSRRLRSGMVSRNALPVRRPARPTCWA